MKRNEKRKKSFFDVLYTDKMLVTWKQIVGNWSIEHGQNNDNTENVREGKKICWKREEIRTAKWHFCVLISASLLRESIYPTYTHSIWCVCAFMLTDWNMRSLDVVYVLWLRVKERECDAVGLSLGIRAMEWWKIHTSICFIFRLVSSTLVGSISMAILDVEAREKKEYTYTPHTRIMYIKWLSHEDCNSNPSYNHRAVYTHRKGEKGRWLGMERERERGRVITDLVSGGVYVLLFKNGRKKNLQVERSRKMEQMN